MIAGRCAARTRGAVRETTNNRMELTAAIEALKALKRPVRATLYTDSKYVCTGVEECCRSGSGAAGRPPIASR